MKKNKIGVVCAIIEIENKILVVQRSESMKLPLKWEFPGGKIEPNESEEEAIKREIREELNIDIIILKRLTPTYYEYPNIAIELIPFLVKYLGGDLELKEHNQHKLLKKEELSSLDWADADLPIIEELQRI
jgi:8-oxo-dGTP diphosphatase